jgi:2-C-methyl-D-erythritol 4-phosphate cytidylyltransferase
MDIHPNKTRIEYAIEPIPNTDKFVIVCNKQGLKHFARMLERDKEKDKVFVQGRTNNVDH